MRRFYLRLRWLPLVLLTACFSLYGAAVPAAEDAVEGYRLATGDRVAISVYGEDDLSIDTYLSDRGTISYPFLGEVEVSGLTIGGLEDLITRQLKGDYLINPRVSVRILEYRKFFVTGQVQKPGGYPYHPGMTVQQAVSLAGGFTERASRNKINVVRDNTSTRAQLNDAVRAGDTITVEESFF